MVVSSGLLSGLVPNRRDQYSSETAFLILQAHEVLELGSRGNAAG